MPTPRVLVLRAPGTNCDIETAFAFEQAGAMAESVHLFRLLEQPDLLSRFQMLCVPGGFSYGDDGGAGVICAAQLKGHLAGVLRDFLQRDTLMLGICNGFQVLMRSGILPGGDGEWPPAPGQLPSATLTWNDNGKYTARWVRLLTAGSQNVFLRGIEELEVPIAHGEGKVVVREPTVLDRWRQRGQIAFCYAPLKWSPGTPDDRAALRGEPLPFPDNPNGSVANIAALSDPTGRVLGLMPHPERHIHATQHPQWTRRGLRPEGDGLRLFRNAVEYFSLS
jgi:phosphoribosylformylglycinamidine synthase